MAQKKLGYLAKERNIIVNSKYAVDNFPILHAFMLTCKALKQNEAEVLENKELSPYLDRKIIKDILAESKKEWRPVSEHGTLKFEQRRIRDRQCQICGTKIQNLFYVENPTTSVELCAGSECITQYGMDQRYVKDFKAQAAQTKRIYRRLDFIAQTGDALQEIERQKSLLAETSIIIPIRLSEKHDRQIQELLRLANQFIVEEMEISIDEFLLKFEQFTKTKQEIIEYEIHNRGNEWVFTRALNNHLRPGHKEQELRLREDGYITARTLSLVTDDVFCRNVIKLLDPYAKSIGFTINSAYPSSDRLDVTYSDPPVKYSMSIKYTGFIDEYGKLLFESTAEAIPAEDFFAKHPVQALPLSHGAALALINSFLPANMHFDTEGVFGDEVYLIFENEGFKTYQDEMVIGSLFSQALANNSEAISEWVSRAIKGDRDPLSKLKERKNAFAKAYATTGEYRYLARRR